MTERAGLLRLPASIFGRMRLLLVAVFTVGTLAAMAAAWAFASAAATEAYDRLLVSAAAQISEAIQIDQGRIVAPSPDSAFETLGQATNDRFFFAVRGPNRQLLTGYSSLWADTSATRDDHPVFGYRHYSGARVRTVTLRRLIASPTAEGWCSVIVAQTLDARHRLVARLLLKIGGIILFVSALGFVSSLEALRRTLMPFDRIARTLAQRRPQDTKPLDVESPREIQALVEAINDAFRRLQDQMSKLQSLAAVAAHQIRTPLAALGAQTEMLLRDKTASARSARAERLRTHIATLSRLTNQLLGQAMVSYRTEKIPHQRVELIELAHQVLRDAVPESLDRDLAVDCDASEQALFVVGDGISLREALVNLVSNAVTHGAPSLLRVQVRREGGYAVVAVADDGPGIPPDVWDSAARPFQLPRNARDGAGLGLSIAADVAGAHGGELLFGRSTDGLFEVVVRLPLARDDGTFL